MFHVNTTKAQKRESFKFFLLFWNTETGFAAGLEVLEKVWNFLFQFPDLEKVWKFREIWKGLEKDWFFRKVLEKRQIDSLRTRRDRQIEARKDRQAAEATKKEHRQANEAEKRPTGAAVEVKRPTDRMHAFSLEFGGGGTDDLSPRFVTPRSKRKKDIGQWPRKKDGRSRQKKAKDQRVDAKACHGNFRYRMYSYLWAFHRSLRVSYAATLRTCFAISSRKVFYSAESFSIDLRLFFITLVTSSWDGANSTEPGCPTCASRTGLHLSKGGLIVLVVVCALPTLTFLTWEWQLWWATRMASPKKNESR